MTDDGGSAVPSNTVGLLSVPMQLEIHGKRKYASDPRLDWCFPDRLQAKLEAEKKSKKQAALEQKALDEQNQRMVGGSKNGSHGGRNGNGIGAEVSMFSQLISNAATDPSLCRKQGVRGQSAGFAPRDGGRDRKDRATRLDRRPFQSRRNGPGAPSVSPLSTRKRRRVYASRSAAVPGGPILQRALLKVQAY